MKNVVVIFGGDSVEHDISLITGAKTLRTYKKIFNLLPIYLGVDNNFYYLKGVDITSYDNKDKLQELGTKVFFCNGAIYLQKKKSLKEILKVDYVINCCHGGIAERGDLSAFLALNKIACTSSNCLTASNKFAVKKFVEGLNIDCLKAVLVNADNIEESINYIKQNFSDQLIIKPNTMGSSIGVVKTTIKCLKTNIELLLHLDSQLIVEEFLEEREELKVAVVRCNNSLCFSAVEGIKLDKDILSFEDKYINRITGKEEVVKILEQTRKKVVELSEKIYKSLQLYGVVEFQFFYLKSTNRLIFNEINLVPKNLDFELFEKIGIKPKMMADFLLSEKENIKKQTYFKTDVFNKIDLFN